MSDPTPPQYVCVPERWLTSDQIAASPNTHVACGIELLRRIAAEPVDHRNRSTTETDQAYRDKAELSALLPK